MAEEQTIVTIAADAPVAAPIVQREVLVTPAEQAVVVETPQQAVISVETQQTVVQSDTEIQVLTVGERGPKGETGASGGALDPGAVTGDFVRFSAGTGLWEVSSEPLELKGIVLVPSADSLVTAEGALYYNASEKAIKVCTDAI